ncbi:DUF736 domain-containing protein [Mycobacterium sp. KBS0706]|nr:DUF736 domain-containing protein [Mycobacterium sp. KBS0706]
MTHLEWRTIQMQRIGSFTRRDEIFEGQITTLTVKLEVRLVPNPEQDDGNGRAPDLLAFSGDAEVGAAWAKQENGRPPYYTIRLDDPSWPSPLSAALFQNRLDAKRFDMVWSRNPGRDGSAP